MQEGHGVKRTHREAQISTSLPSLIQSRLLRKSLQQECTALCTRCKGAHHRSIYSETDTVITQTKDTSPTTFGKIDVASPSFTYLQTARIWVMGPIRLSKLTRCVLDAGSQSTFVAKTLLDDLKLKVFDRRDLVVSALSHGPLTQAHAELRASAQRAYGKIPPYISLPLRVITPYVLTPQSLMTPLLRRRLAKYKLPTRRREN